MARATKAQKAMIAELEQAVTDNAIATLDYVDNKVRRRKAIAEIGDTITNSGLSWDASAKTIVMYVSRFSDGRPDKVNDIIDPGAFDKWLARWQRDPLVEYPHTKGRLPCIFSHKWDSIPDVIGWAAAEDCTVDTKGLLIAFHLFDTPEAERVWTIGRDMGWAASFSFDVAPNGEHKKKLGRKTVNVITEFAHVHEAGPCVAGANPDAGTRAVKSDDRALAEFGNVVRLAAKKGIKAAQEVLAEMNAGPLTGDSMGNGVVAPAYAQNRCASCGVYASEPKRPVAPGAARWNFCGNCGEVELIAQKGWTPARIKAEADRIFRRITIIDTVEQKKRDRARSNRLAAELRVNIKKAKQRADVAALVKFSKAPARPSRADVRRDVAELQSFVQKSTKRTPTDITSLFGDAPAIRPDQL